MLVTIRFRKMISLRFIVRFLTVAYAHGLLLSG